MRRSLGLLLICSGACGGGEDPVETLTTDIYQGACGDVLEFDLIISGVVHRDGEPTQGASVYLEESIWTRGETWGSVTTDADGRFSLDARNLVAVEDCWGVVIDYQLYALQGPEQGTQDMNSPLSGAYRDSLTEYELFYPIDIEPLDSTSSR